LYYIVLCWGGLVGDVVGSDYGNIGVAYAHVSDLV